MRFPAAVSGNTTFVAFLLAFLVAFSGICPARKTLSSKNSSSNCVAFSDASKYMGTAQCVSGTVLHVEHGSKGATFLTFCKEAKACPFTVVVFPTDTKKMGDIRQLEGRQIEIKGTIQDYDGRAQIVLRRTQQLGESAYVVIPRVPTDYDVEKTRHNSAGSIHKPKAAKTKTTKQTDPMSIEDPSEPQ
jgi:DNA/RNA endonuclease YhcR with UshA esterase domain